MSIETDSLLDAEAGETLNPSVTYRPYRSPSGPGAFFVRRSGPLTVTSVGEGSIEGTFQFRMKDIAVGCLRCVETTVSGAFRAEVEPAGP